MTFTDDLLELMPATVTWQKATGRSAYGNEVLGAAGTSRARVVRKMTMLRDSVGEERVADTVVWLADAPGLNPEDRITLPDGATPQIMAVERYTDETGEVFEKVLCGGSRG
jgi:hypothetical protein